MFDRDKVQGSHRLGRRAFLQGSTLLLAGTALSRGKAARLLAATEDDGRPLLRVGLATDLHHADKTAAGNRHYRMSLAKFAEATKQFELAKTDYVITLGDTIDSADSVDGEKDYLKQVAHAFAQLPAKHHFVLGNHCVSNLTKSEFLEIVGQERSYYSFDAAGVHFVILDACFRGDGEPYGRKNFDWTDSNIRQSELEWLRTDLRRTPNKSIVGVHQCLDVAAPYGIKNSVEVRAVLEESGKVLAVLQGHYHKGNYQEIGGIAYCTLTAVVEGSSPEDNAYAVMDILPDDAIRIRGFRRQQSHHVNATMGLEQRNTIVAVG